MDLLRILRFLTLVHIAYLVYLEYLVYLDVFRLSVLSFLMHALMYWFAPAFGDSDEDDINPEDSLMDILDEGPGSLHQPSSPVPVSCPPPSPPFDMVDFMLKSSSYDMPNVFKSAEEVPSIPRHVPSERPGGEARRDALKSRASNFTRSVCEVFAFSTSRTLSAEDTAVVLETFGNVSCL